MRPSQTVGPAILLLSVFANPICADDTLPTVIELKAFLGVAIDDPEFVKFAKDNNLKKAYKFDEGTFSPEDSSFSLLYRKDKIEKILLSVRRPGESELKTYTAELPSKIAADDGLEKVIERCGKPDSVSANKDKSHVVAGFDKRRLIVVFENERISEVWLSREPFSLKVPEDASAADKTS